MSTEAVSIIDNVELADVDVFDARWHAQGPPHKLLARMRTEAPVRWNRFPDGSGCWTVARHADVAAVSRDTATFSTSQRGIFLHPDQGLPLDLMRNLLLYMDPPKHTRFRLVLQKAFVPHTVTVLEGAIRARVTKVIDRVIERGACDFVEDIAVPIPLGVLVELLGVPEDDIGKLYDWTQQLEAAVSCPEPSQALEVIQPMAAYVAEQIQRQSAEERADSLVTKLRDGRIAGAPLTDAETLMFFMVLVFAGNDTTRNTAATGMHALLEHPDALAELQHDRSLVVGAVEEILRYTSVAQWFARTATTDTTLAGRPIAKGDRVVIWYTSASRDESVFDEPQAFDIHRAKPDHDAFGGGGRHFCLGAGLARLELRVIFEEVTRRMRDIQLAGDIERLASNWAHGLIKMPVSFTPGQREHEDHAD